MPFSFCHFVTLLLCYFVMINLNHFKILSFDCYGTLIDWESGILNALKPIALKNHLNLSDDQILNTYAMLETEIEAGQYQAYRNVLRQVMINFADHFDFILPESETDTLANSVRDWPPFPDTVEALSILKQKYELAILSNVDDDLLSYSSKHLKTQFDIIFTAQQIGSYKPAERNFQHLLENIDIPPDQLLHVAQSIFHDVVPAKKMGLATVWVNRRKGKEGFGATPKAHEFPDLEVPDLETLAELINS